MPLTKIQAKQHAQACKLLEKDQLSFDERCFVITHFHEGGDSNNTWGSAHFTPYELANDFKLDVMGPRILDLCAGIGVLAFAYFHGWDHGEHPPEMVCLELDPRYVEVGRKVLPEAEWIQGDIFDPKIQKQLAKRPFTTAISNPPFGKNAMRGRQAPRYTGGLFEYALIDIASDLADYGAFIIPQGSSPFLFSGVRCYQDCRRPLPNDPLPGQARANLKKYRPFTESTSIELEPGVGIDTTVFRDQWRGVSPAVEVVTAEFGEVQEARKIGIFESTKQLALGLAG